MSLVKYSEYAPMPGDTWRSFSLRCRPMQGKKKTRRAWIDVVTKCSVALWILIQSAGLTEVCANELKGHASPYLALHGDDPVDWREWSRAVLEEARHHDRPVFISSGYFACHWCHVMQRESYRNAAIAKLLNEHFVPVKLDRELDPAIDDHLIRFVERMTGLAGWPLNVFLTPEGYPLTGMTYLPAEDFEQVLMHVARRWQQQSDDLRNQARIAAEAMAGEQRPPSAEPLPADVIVSRLITDALGQADELAGGFGTQSKFPMEPRLMVLLAVNSKYPDPQLRRFLVLTLEQMSSRGLRDHLGGGFFRYTVDPGWLTPHYEKMLYNQAQLIRVYLTAARVLGRTDFLQVARDTLDFVLRDMAGYDGGFVASLSAVDEAGEEGAAYLWQASELARVLEEDELKLATLYWSLEAETSPEAGYLPQRLRSVEEVAETLQLSPGQLSHRVQVARDKLLARRALRAPPRDTKQLAGWNGLLLSALTQAVQATGDEGYADSAAALSGYLRSLWDGERLHRARQGPRFLGEATLEDYASVAEGLAAWAQLSQEGEALRETARAIAERAWRDYFTSAGWRLSATAGLPLMVREPAMHDGALRAPSAVLMKVTRSLTLADGDSTDLPAALALSVAQVNEAPLRYAGHALRLIEADRKAVEPLALE